MARLAPETDSVGIVREVRSKFVQEREITHACSSMFEIVLALPSSS
jgi:hypothetical protein